MYSSNNIYSIMSDFNIPSECRPEFMPESDRDLMLSLDELSSVSPLKSLVILSEAVSSNPSLHPYLFPILQKILASPKSPEIISQFEQLIGASTGYWQAKYLGLLAEFQPEKAAIDIYSSIWEIIYSLNLQLPEIQSIIPLDLCPDPSPQALPDKPSQVYSSKFIETWWTYDNTEIRSTVNLALMINDFRSTLAKSVTADIMAILLSLGLSNSLGLRLARAGTSFAIEPLDNCFEIKITGHYSSLLDSVEKIMEFLYNSSPNSEDLEKAVDILRSQYLGMATDPLSQSRQLRLTFLQHCQYLYSEKLEFLQNMSPSELNLSNVKILLFVAGNFGEEQALGISEFIEGLLFAAEAKKLKYLSPRTITLLPEQVIECAQASNKEESEESVVEVYLQLGQASIEERVMASLLENVLNERIFQALVADRKVCRSVAVTSRMTRGVSGILVKAICEETHPDLLQREIFGYLEENCKGIAEGFEEAKRELIKIKRHDCRSFADKSGFYWDEILQGNVEFERQRKEVAFLEELKCGAFEDWIAKNKFLKKALVVKVTAQKWGEVNGGIYEEIAMDIEAFRNKYPCYSWLRIMH